MFTKDTKKEVEVKGIPEIPEYSTQETYRLTIEKITKRKVAETATAYVALDNGEIVTASYQKEDGREYARFSYPTGKIETSTTEEKLYVQDLESLDIGELATYINRTR